MSSHQPAFSSVSAGFRGFHGLCWGIGRRFRITSGGRAADPLKMQPSPVFLVVSSLALFGVTAVIAVRLLWLAWRSGEVPERLMGLGLSCLLFVYFPAMAASGMGRVPSGEVNLLLLALASPFFMGGFACMVGFTWRVFRPQDGWALVLAFALSLTLAALLGAMVSAVRASPPELDSFTAGQLWSGLLRLPMIAAFGWTGLEGALSHMKARRRLELGLSDPVVTNRFLLWAIVGFAQVILNAVGVILHFKGLGMMASPTGLMVVSIGAGTGAIAMWLVFFPPQFYIRLLERRATALAS